MAEPAVADAVASAGEAVAASSAPPDLTRPLRQARLEAASFRVCDSAANAAEPENGAVVSLQLADGARGVSETVDLALTPAELHQLLATLRGIAATVSGLGNAQGGGSSD